MTQQAALPETNSDGVVLGLRDYEVVVRGVPVEWLDRAEAIYWCESGADPAAERYTVVRGRRYHVIGLMQLLYDDAVARVAQEMGYNENDLFGAEANLQVAYEWDKRTGGNFKAWSCR